MATYLTWAFKLQAVRFNPAFIETWHTGLLNFELMTSGQLLPAGLNFDLI